MKKIVALGPNPARQKTLFFNHFKRDAVNRAVRMEELPAGKGINFCRAMRCGGLADPVLIQFCGGVNGDFVNEELTKEGMRFISIPTAGATRCCITCLDETDKVMTEIIEPTKAASAVEVQAILDAFEGELKTASGAAFCGSLPDGTTPSLYIRAAEIVAKKGIPLLIDAFRDLDGVFGTGVKVVLKINREELEKLAGIADGRAALKAVFARFPSLQAAAITDGGKPAFAYNGKHYAEFPLPPLAAMVNPIGSGDTASATLMAHLTAGETLFDAFAAALAAASANCLNSTPGYFLAEEAAKLIPPVIELSEL